jgi:hypothetical protein
MEQSVPSSPAVTPKGNYNNIILLVVIIVVVVVIVVAALLLNKGGNDGAGNNNGNGTTSGTMVAGDYLYYGSPMGAFSSTHIWMNLTSTDSNSYVFSVDNNGFAYPQTLSKTAVIDPLNMYSSSMTSLGSTSISTPLGSRTVNHYQTETMGMSIDYYVGANKIVYKVVYGYNTGSISITLLLESSSLTWV